MKKNIVLCTVISLLAVGTASSAPFTVNKVPRANSGHILTDGTIYDNGINVGIGKSTPQAKLDVDGNIYSTGLKIYSVGNTGLGTSGPRNKLDVIGNVESTGLIVDNALYNGTVKIGVGTTSPNFSVDVNGTVSSWNVISKDDVIVGVPKITFDTTFPDVFIQGNLSVDGVIYGNGGGINWASVTTSQLQQANINWQTVTGL